MIMIESILLTCSRFRLRYSPCSDAYHRELEDSVLTRVGGNVRSWEKGVYSFESVERIVDTKNNLVSFILPVPSSSLNDIGPDFPDIFFEHFHWFYQVYLERTGSNTGILTWKIDFAPCGLVVDQISIKVESRCLNGGDVLVMLASGEIKKTISHMEGIITFIFRLLQLLTPRRVTNNNV